MAKNLNLGNFREYLQIKSFFQKSGSVTFTFIVPYSTLPNCRGGGERGGTDGGGQTPVFE